MPDDPVLAPMYPADDLAGAEDRLADFLVMRLGGSTRYAETRGHPRLRMRHARFELDEAAERQWLACMDAALDEAGEELPTAARETLREFLHGVARFLRNA